jgi:hypothetical protein
VTRLANVTYTPDTAGMLGQWQCGCHNPSIERASAQVMPSTQRQSKPGDQRLTTHPAAIGHAATLTPDCSSIPTLHMHTCNQNHSDKDPAPSFEYGYEMSSKPQTAIRCFGARATVRRCMPHHQTQGVGKSAASYRPATRKNPTSTFCSFPF